MDNQNRESFADVKSRLDEIVDAVNDENISLDDALSLYEEAVKLGMKATSLLEEDIDQEQIDEAASALENVEAAANEQIEAEKLDARTTDQVEAGAEAHE